MQDTNANKQEPALEEHIEKNKITSRPFTFGEKAVGLTFNPSRDPLVDEIKGDCARLIDKLEYQRATASAGSQKGRMYSIAITDIQTAQMWAVKALTWQD